MKFTQEHLFNVQLSDNEFGILKYLQAKKNKIADLFRAFLFYMYSNELANQLSEKLKQIKIAIWNRFLMTSKSKT